MYTGCQTKPESDRRPGSDLRDKCGRAVVWPFAIVILLAGLAAYHNSLTCPFVFDDEESIVENDNIRHLRPPWQALTAPPQSAVAGRPVVCLTLAVNYALGGLDPWGYHLFNLGVHVLAALTLFGIVRRTLSAPGLRDRFGRSAPALAGTAAVLWLVHPLQTESVTYVVQRAESLAGLCCLLTLYCSVRAFETARPTAWQAAAVIACAVGMGTKEVTAIMPLLVWLYDRTYVSGSLGGALRRHARLYAALAATWIILGALVAAGPRSASAGFGVEGLTSIDYAKTQFGVILHYLRLVFYPHPLCLDYAWPVAVGVWEIIAPMTTIAVIFVATGWAFRRHPAVGFLGAWFFIALAPSSSVVPIVDLAFEHRMYLPLAAICVLIVIAMHTLIHRMCRPPAVSERIRRGIAASLAVTVTVTLIFLTVGRNRDYRSAMTIWSDVVAQRPDNPRGHNNLAKAMHKRGDLARAEAHYREALRLKPDYATAHNNLAAALAEQGRGDQALYHYDQALQLDPDWAEAHYNRGLALAGLGRFDEAAAAYNQALRLRSAYPEAHYSLANSLLRLDLTDAAVEHYTEALRQDPDYLEAHFNLAGALAGLGRADESQQHLTEVLRIDAHHPAARHKLNATSQPPD